MLSSFWFYIISNDHLITTMMSLSLREKHCPYGKIQSAVMLMLLYCIKSLFTNAFCTMYSPSISGGKRQRLDAGRRKNVFKNYLMDKTISSVLFFVSHFCFHRSLHTGNGISFYLFTKVNNTKNFQSSRKSR